MTSFLNTFRRSSLVVQPVFCNFVKKTALAVQFRSLNLLEYQSKHMLQQNGVNIQNFVIVEKPEDTGHLLEKFSVREYVIKAQILAGGRGLGHFDNGFKGGVHITKDPTKVPPYVQQMVGHRLITKQTTKEGILVHKVMVAESVDIKRETYICILMDRQHNGPVVIASPAGGTDIENIAKETPDLIKTVPVDIFEGVTQEMADSIADFLEFRGTLKAQASEEIMKLWSMFVAVDATQLEINPFVETVDGKVVSVDAKIQFDDNAKFRHADIFALEDYSERDVREVEAEKCNLNYIGMTGNIGCLVNGAGLAMATMDLIKLHGGEPANFLDVGGAVNEDQVFQAFKILTADERVKAILVNVFGGIVNCATIASGIVNASRTMKLTIPLIVRLEGNNVLEAKKILKNSGLAINSASDLEDAAQKAVSSLRSCS